jgi:predicted DNA-binding antitoxin AbrB/MazE fold protein
MMAGTIRAVYERGQLRPLEPLALRDGQEVRTTAEPDHLAGLLDGSPQVWRVEGGALNPID